jgi:hypothetical protein
MRSERVLLSALSNICTDYSVCVRSACLYRVYLISILAGVHESNLQETYGVSWLTTVTTAAGRSTVWTRASRGFLSPPRNTPLQNLKLSHSRLLAHLPQFISLTILRHIVGVTEDVVTSGKYKHILVVYSKEQNRI